MEIINAIPEYVITAVVSTAIFYGMKYVEKLIHAKVLHAKTAQSKELWSFIEQVSTVAVNSLVSAQMTGDEKFTKATAIVQDSLNRQGFKNVDVKAIEAAVQSAYEKADLKAKKPTSKPVLIATPHGIVASSPSQSDIKDMPGASKKVETKPYSPETAKSIKGIPTGNLEDIAVQTPKKEEGADNGN